MRTKMRSPSAGQYRAETTITVTNATMENSPPVSPKNDTTGEVGQLPRASKCRFRRTMATALDCVLGLGSNLGDRREYLRAAARKLQQHAQISAISALYETDPIGPRQPDYLNAAIRLRLELEPAAILELLLGIERALGRERTERWGPRTLDLDLLFIADRSVDIPGLVVPHRELVRRAFALLPLLDVMPEAAEPGTGRPYAELVQLLDRTGVRELPNSRAGWLEMKPGEVLAPV